VDVIRRVFAKAADGKSCVAIANDLTRLGVPPAYVRDVLRGKRKRGTAGIWRPSRIRNLIISKTYKGIHEWGKRTKASDADGGKVLKASPPEKWVTRPCLAIVDEALWQKANATLHKNQNVAMAHAKNDYLLRGLIRCGLCGLTYIGTAVTRPSGKKEFYYRCNGKHGARGLYGENGQRCPSPSVRGTELESAVWTDIQVFLAKPGAVLRQLEQQIKENGNGQKVADEIAELEGIRARKAEARRRTLDAYTDGWISKEEFGKKLRIIDAETVATEERLTELRKLCAEQDANAQALGAARNLLEELQSKTRGKMPFEQRRRAVEALVQNITVTPVDGPKQPRICIQYTFEPHHERYSRQWESRASLALSNTGRSSAPQQA
jgi:site-specific DNA recombinase